MNGLHDKGHKIVIVTARADDWHVKPKEITYLWLQKSGLKYDEVFVGEKDKKQICKSLDVDIFVDDDIKITRDVADYFAT